MERPNLLDPNRQNPMIAQLMDRTYTLYHKMEFHSVGMAVCEPLDVLIQAMMDLFLLDQLSLVPCTRYILSSLPQLLDCTNESDKQ